MNAADSAWSPKRFWSTLGMRKAALHASASRPRPKQWAGTRCRTRPVMRVRKMPMPTERAPERAFGAPATSINVLVRYLRAERAARSLHQVRLDEDVDVAVEHTVDVSNLFLRPVILHQSIGSEHV